MRHHRERPTLLRADGDDSRARTLRRQHRAGLLVRLRAGTYLARTSWVELDQADRHLVRIWAVAPVVPTGAAFSHVSAALVHGWPLVGPAPERVHVTVPGAERTVHRAGLVLHATGGAQVRLAPARLDGVPVTDLVTTASTVATSMPVHVAAVAIDGAVRAGALTPSELATALPAGPARGSRRAQTVLRALDARHETVGESYTAVRLVESGIDRVVPQHEFRHDHVVDRVDFWLPDSGTVIEFDGKVKYTDPMMLAGRDPGEVAWAEKRREDRLRQRSEVRTVIRVTWWHLERLDRFQGLVRAHGLVL
ncbi:hypothetical protein [Curtobacterium sp. NPDC092190]|uniref:hypothetical protein n=1 Tax=Curtobacterium sp. NPDC092190 TaxID=3363973 RepID=UPI0038002F2A